MSASAFRVAIVGGGPVGLAIAARLAAGTHGRHLALRLLDGGPAPQWSVEHTDLRVYALSRASQRLLQGIGVWEAVAARRVSPYSSMQVWDGGHDDPGGVLRFEAADIGEPDLGHIVEDSLLRVALIEHLRSHTDVTLTFGARVASLEQGEDRATLRLEDGERVRADLIIAADGGSSRLRELAGLPVISCGYGQHAIVTHVSTEHDHELRARQRFLPDGPLAFLPLSDGRVSIVWSMPSAKAKALQVAAEPEFLQALQEASDGVLGTLSAPSPRGAFPLRMLHLLRYTQPGLVLTGDAAHTVHPLAGQGMNLGLLDAAQLASTLERALDEGQTPGDLRVLRRYERASKGENLAMLLALDAMARGFPVSGLTSPLRRAGFAIMQGFAPGRRWLMRQALGTSSPRSARY